MADVEHFEHIPTGRRLVGNPGTAAHARMVSMPQEFRPVKAPARPRKGRAADKDGDEQ